VKSWKEVVLEFLRGRYPRLDMGFNILQLGHFFFQAKEAMNIKGTGGLNFMPTAELGRFMTTLLGCRMRKKDFTMM
jgi:hypothetical protein